METKYLRNKKTIVNTELKTRVALESINKAKKESRRLQGNKLGQGLLSVVK